MTPMPIISKIVVDRLEWIMRMNQGIRDLPLSDYEQFVSDPKNIAAAESYLRRSIEALFDLCRHILAKGFAKGTLEYKQIAQEMHRLGIIDDEDRQLLRDIAGYRNRMVHFYHEISERELHGICKDQLGDIDQLANDIVKWINANPDMIDNKL
jgi:uncharacterized protein YutE (UPF0331/DUF86 family)